MGTALVQTPHLQSNVPLAPWGLLQPSIVWLTLALYFNRQCIVSSTMNTHSPQKRLLQALICGPASPSNFGTVLLPLRAVHGAQNFQCLNCHLAERQYWACCSLTSYPTAVITAPVSDRTSGPYCGPPVRARFVAYAVPKWNLSATYAATYCLGGYLGIGATLVV